MQLLSITMTARIRRKPHRTAPLTSPPAGQLAARAAMHASSICADSYSSRTEQAPQNRKHSCSEVRKVEIANEFWDVESYMKKGCLPAHNHSRIITVI